MIDQLRQIAIFAKTIDHGSFRGAAKELHLSPSVVSHHISQLEEHLGVALIYRTTRKLSLTREGKRLLAAARSMLDVVQGEIQALSAEANEPSGALRVTAPSVLSMSPFTDMIAEFMVKYPRINLSLDFSDERKELIENGFDLAIRMGLQAKRSPSTRRLFDAQRVLVASPDFIENYSAPSEPADLEDWQWLELAPLSNTPVHFRKDGKKQIVQQRNSQLTCNDAQALYRLSRAGAGLALIPEYLASQDLASGRIKVVLPDWQLETIKIYAEWPTNAPKNGLIRLLTGELENNKTGFQLIQS
ncbi:MAG: LysR family transcriptional regulator [Pseudomonadota bacterium]